MTISIHEKPRSCDDCESIFSDREWAIWRSADLDAVLAAAANVPPIDDCGRLFDSFTLTEDDVMGGGFWTMTVTYRQVPVWPSYEDRVAMGDCDE